MWFFVAVLILWGTTTMLGRQDDIVLPPIVVWGWWTIVLYLPGWAAVEESWATIQAKLFCVFGFFLLTAYFTTQSAIYLPLLPTNADHPELWPSVFLTVNLLGPMVIVVWGCISPVIQRGR